MSVNKQVLYNGKKELPFNVGTFIFTDGSVRTDATKVKGFRGGCGCVLFHNGKEMDSVSLPNDDTTISRMEMTAMLQALIMVEKYNINHVVIASDSQLVIKGINEWMDGWKRKGWTNASKNEVENKDLWMLIDDKLQKLNSNILFVWMNGHEDHAGNDRADEVANEAVEVTK